MMSRTAIIMYLNLKGWSRRPHARATTGITCTSIPPSRPASGMTRTSTCALQEADYKLDNNSLYCYCVDVDVIPLNG